jgi:hypothetical protein
MNSQATCPQCRAFPGACLEHRVINPGLYYVQPTAGNIYIAPGTAAPIDGSVQTFDMPMTIPVGPDYKAMWEAAQAEIAALKSSVERLKRRCARRNDHIVDLVAENEKLWRGHRG